MTERQPGVWRLRVVVAYRHGRPVQRSKTVRGTKRVAQTELARFVAEHARSDHRDPDLTFDAFLTRHYLPHLREHRSPETVRDREGMLRRVAAIWGPMRLSQLTPYDLDAVYRHLTATGRQPSTVRAYHRGLSAALGQAVRWRMIPENPATLASPPSVPRRASTMPTLAQIGQLIGAANDKPVLMAAITVGALTGLRRGELCGLQWGDVDWERGLLVVRRAIKRGLGSSLVAGPPKGGKQRILALDAATVTVLEAHRARAEEWARQTSKHLGSQSYVFAREPDGKRPMAPTSLTEQFHALALKVGCPWVRLHDLRHAVASHLLAQGYDVTTVAGRLGHSTPNVTLSVYAQVLEERDRQAAGVMSRLLGLGSEARVVDDEPPPNVHRPRQALGSGELVDGLGTDPDATS